MPITTKQHKTYYQIIRTALRNSVISNKYVCELRLILSS